MARVTQEEVETIIEVDAGVDLTPFIDVANDLVTDVCSDSSYTDAKLKLIELWLSAHFFTVMMARTASEGAAGINDSFQGSTDMYFESSIYGQHAMLIDRDGNLAAVQAKAKATGSGDFARKTVRSLWLGKADE